MDKGILYITASDEYLYQEAVLSAKSVKEVMPELDIAVITDVANTPDVFDITIKEESIQGTFSDKAYNMNRTPFEKTIFLDTDTYITENISELFELLSDNDIFAAHTTHSHFPLPDVPESFPSYNTGVIGFDTNEKTHKLFQKWEKVFKAYNEEKNIEADQVSFRNAVYKSNADLITIRPEYNCRTPSPGFIGGEVKIIHGRGGYDKFERVLNEHIDTPRVYFRNWRGFNVVTNGNPDPYGLIRSLEHRGVMGTIAKIKNKFLT